MPAKKSNVNSMATPSFGVDWYRMLTTPERLSPRATGQAPPPRFLFVEINKRCNLRCGHCDFWMRDDDDRANYLSGPRKREVLREFHEMNPSGSVVICGGEPMLDLEDYFGVSTECRALGLRAISVVNGTRIRSDSMADRMIREGPHEISISLNACDEALHDETRGVKGAFKKAVRALRLLVAARKRNPSSRTRIYVMGLIFDRNYRELDRFYDFVLNDIGADKLKLNFLQPTFGQMGEESQFFSEHGHVDPDELGDLIAACNRKYKLDLNPVWLGQVKMYFRSLNAARDLDKGWHSRARTSEHICNTYERNIMVNHYGVARLCFATAFRGMQLERYGDLRKLGELPGRTRPDAHVQSVLRHQS
jgi:MoaA/NifB/PqqE/SkfB family radical SAM enzyme